MRQIEWLENSSELNVDWCGKYEGKYVDLTRNDVWGTWSFYYNNLRITGGFATRKDAHAALLQYLVNLQ